MSRSLSSSTSSPQGSITCWIIMLLFIMMIFVSFGFGCKGILLSLLCPRSSVFLYTLKNVKLSGGTLPSTYIITSQWQSIQTTSESFSRYFISCFATFCFSKISLSGCKGLDPEKEPGRPFAAMTCGICHLCCVNCDLLGNVTFLVTVDM